MARKKRSKEKPAESVDAATGEVAPAVDAPFTPEEQRELREAFAELGTLRTKRAAQKSLHQDTIAAAKEAKERLVEIDGAVSEVWDRIAGIGSGAPRQEKIPFGDGAETPVLPEGVTEEGLKVARALLKEQRVASFSSASSVGTRSSAPIARPKKELVTAALLASALFETEKPRKKQKDLAVRMLDHLVDLGEAELVGGDGTDGGALWWAKEKAE